MWFKRLAPRVRRQRPVLEFIRFWDVFPGMRFYHNERGVGGYYIKTAHFGHRLNARHIRNGRVWRTCQIKDYSGVYIEVAERERFVTDIVKKVGPRPDPVP
jgi:hypothetical protein